MGEGIAMDEFEDKNVVHDMDEVEDMDVVYDMDDVEDKDVVYDMDEVENKVYGIAFVSCRNIKFE